MMFIMLYSATGVYIQKMGRKIIFLMGAVSGFLAINLFLYAEETNPSSVAIIKRTPKIEMYKCDECHDSEETFNETIRPMKKGEDHENITTFHPQKKDDPKFWCLNCHASKNYNKLVLPSGEKISLNESHRLCGECHGPTLKDWKDNIHGKIIGGWKENRQAYSCTACHDAHDPAWKPVEPVPEPKQ